MLAVDPPALDGITSRSSKADMDVFAGLFICGLHDDDAMPGRRTGFDVEGGKGRTGGVGPAVGKLKLPPSCAIPVRDDVAAKAPDSGNVSPPDACGINAGICG